MYKQQLLKPDGRNLTLYSRSPIDPTIVATSPSAVPVEQAGAHLRWHPLRGEWVAYAGHRQNRTFLPPKEFNPLAPTQVGHPPTELPSGVYDVAVFDNMFPTLRLHPNEPPLLPGLPCRSALGACEVVVFTQNPDSALGRLPLSHLELVIAVWADRTRELGEFPEIKYVMPFENRGVEVGVTLHHPHGQIYAYPFIPPVASQQLDAQRRYFEIEGRGLLLDFIERELADPQRLLYVGPEALAFVPACARYPYEVWVLPRRAVALLSELTPVERLDLARALKTVLLKFEGLWSRPFPYLMVLHQGVSDGKPHPESHLHFEFSPPYRSADRLKFLAGTELGAGLFANDSYPEAKARELQAVEVKLDGD